MFSTVYHMFLICSISKFFFFIQLQYISLPSYHYKHANFKFDVTNQRFDLSIPLTGTEFIGNNTGRSRRSSI